MKTTTPIRTLPALLLAALVGSVAFTSAASAAPWPTATTAPVAAPTTVLQVEQKLAALNYDVGTVDGKTDDQTVSAIMAFQKVSGLERTGGLTDQVTAQIMATQSAPAPLVPNGEP